jgi:maltose/moltooligosaccharide transporter
MSEKPKLKFWQLWNMSFGFLGIQYAFGLQQANMSPIYRYLGAEESEIPWLWLAGPITGLVIQPIIGAMSDNTWHPKWGRRRPFFAIGAVLTSIALILMPFSQSLWMAAGLLWLLDGAANITMEPFRALIADKLRDDQRSVGYSLQSFFVGFGQTLANLMPIVLASFGFATVAAANTTDIPDFVKYSFIIGALTILITIGITVFTTVEYPPTEEELSEKAKEKTPLLKEIATAFGEMPKAMRQLWWVKFFTWFSLPIMWQYLAIAIANKVFHTSDPNSPGFADGVKWGNLGLAVFNVFCLLFSLLLPYLSRNIKPKFVHAIALTIGGIGFIGMNFFTTEYQFMAGMALVGIAWASIMSTPYVILSNGVPANKMGVYMGIFNMFIVVPQITNMLLLPLIYEPILGNDPAKALLLAGICLVVAAGFCLRLKSDHEALNQLRVK